MASITEVLDEIRRKKAKEDEKVDPFGGDREFDLCQVVARNLGLEVQEVKDRRQEFIDADFELALGEARRARSSASTPLPNDEVEEEDESEEEAGALGDAISLVEDVHQVLQEVLNPQHKGRLSPLIVDRLEEAEQECAEFLTAYDWKETDADEELI